MNVFDPCLHCKANENVTSWYWFYLLFAFIFQYQSFILFFIRFSKPFSERIYFAVFNCTLPPINDFKHKINDYSVFWIKFSAPFYLIYLQLLAILIQKSQLNLHYYWNLIFLEYFSIGLKIDNCSNLLFFECDSSLQYLKKFAGLQF